MGRDIHVKIITRDRITGSWKQIKLYKKESEDFNEVDIYPFRNYKLFDILNGNEDNIPYNSIIIQDLPTDLREEIEKCEDIPGYYGFKEINLADLKLYLMNHPKIRDYDYEENDPKAWGDNPIKYFIEKIEQYVELAIPYWDFYCIDSDIRIIYWFDC